MFQWIGSKMVQTLVKQSVQTELVVHPTHGWLQLFDEENIQLVILDSHLDIELIQAIRSQPKWNVDFEDDELVVFTSNKR
jgi:hypothetical protein